MHRRLPLVFCGGRIGYSETTGLALASETVVPRAALPGLFRVGGWRTGN